MRIDWKGASLVFIVFVLFTAMFDPQPPSFVFICVLCLIAVNFLLNRISWRMYSGQWVLKSCIAQRVSGDSVYYVVCYPIDAAVTTDYFFGEGAKDRAVQHLKDCR
jgi:hypothetical protein